MNFKTDLVVVILGAKGYYGIRITFEQSLFLDGQEDAIARQIYQKASEIPDSVIVLECRSIAYISSAVWAKLVEVGETLKDQGSHLICVRMSGLVESAYAMLPDHWRESIRSLPTEGL